ncbi:MAG: leucyl/phenylalanyl-tRNA--protein transferase [Acidimicrobiales bacterium]|nr:leucyl/phenylalanyl-tRNA--protein transferase [Acidimicrobiales bacterium]
MISVPSDLTVPALLRAYRAGYFPMPVRRRIAWFSPNPRGIFLPGHLRVPRSLQQAAKRYEIRLNTSFDEVISACADPARPMGWINRPILDAFTELHHQGYAHSVEAWDTDGLAGGLYGISVGGLFAGESMFHRRRDASKVALMALARIMEMVPGSIIDTQWTTEHLVSLGAFDVARTDYAKLLEDALALSPPPPFADPAALQSLASKDALS